MEKPEVHTAVWGNLAKKFNINFSAYAKFMLKISRMSEIDIDGWRYIFARMPKAQYSSFQVVV